MLSHRRSDPLGVDFFEVGEHHRPDFAVSSPEIVLAAIAGKTERIAWARLAGRNRRDRAAE